MDRAKAHATTVAGRRGRGKTEKRRRGRRGAGLTRDTGRRAAGGPRRAQPASDWRPRVQNGAGAHALGLAPQDGGGTAPNGPGPSERAHATAAPESPPRSTGNGRPTTVTPGLSIVPLTNETFDRFLALAGRLWQRPLERAYVDWRYGLAGKQETLLAMQGRECVGTIGGMERRYRMGQGEVRCLEVVDWHVLPEYRGPAGIVLYRALMRKGLPLVSAGGSAQALSIVPRLGFTRVATGGRYILQLSGEAVGRFRGTPLHALVQLGFKALGPLWFSTRRRYHLHGGACHVVAGFGEKLEPLCAERGPQVFGPLPEPAILRWLTAGYAHLGLYVPLMFTVGGNLRGFSVCRVFEAEDDGSFGNRVRAQICHVYTPSQDLATYRWMISESIAVLAGFSPCEIQTATTCPTVTQALTDHHFRYWGDFPLYVYSKNERPPAGDTFASWLSTDGAFLPLPAQSALRRAGL